MFSSHLNPKVDCTFVKTSSLRINLNLDGDPIVSQSHSPITLVNLSSIYLFSIIRCSSPPNNPVYARRVDPSDLDFSLSSHRHSYKGLLTLSIHNKQRQVLGHLKSKVGNILVKSSSLRITLNIDDTSIVSGSHTHPSHSQTSRLLTLSLSLGVPVPHGTQCRRRNY